MWTIYLDCNLLSCRTQFHRYWSLKDSYSIIAYDRRLSPPTSLRQLRRGWFMIIGRPRAWNSRQLCRSRTWKIGLKDQLNVECIPQSGQASNRDLSILFECKLHRQLWRHTRSIQSDSRNHQARQCRWKRACPEWGAQSWCCALASAGDQQHRCAVGWLGLSDRRSTTDGEPFLEAQQDTLDMPLACWFASEDKTAAFKLDLSLQQ